MGAMPMGAPGWPELAANVASTCSPVSCQKSACQGLWGEGGRKSEPIGTGNLEECSTARSSWTPPRSPGSRATAARRCYMRTPKSCTAREDAVEGRQLGTYGETPDGVDGQLVDISVRHCVVAVSVLWRGLSSAGTKSETVPIEGDGRGKGEGGRGRERKDKSPKKGGELSRCTFSPDLKSRWIYGGVGERARRDGTRARTRATWGSVERASLLLVG